MQYTGR